MSCTKNFFSNKGVFEKVKEIVNKPLIKRETLMAKNKILQKKIDLTAFLLWFIENYPQSIEVMKSNPEYQYNFK